MHTCDDQLRRSQRLAALPQTCYTEEGDGSKKRSAVDAGLADEQQNKKQKRPQVVKQSRKRSAAALSSKAVKSQPTTARRVVKGVRPASKTKTAKRRKFDDTKKAEPKTNKKSFFIRFVRILFMGIFLSAFLSIPFDQPPTKRAPPSAYHQSLIKSCNFMNMPSGTHMNKSNVRKAYKMASLVHHPDKGGSHEAMIELQDHYEHLLKAVKGKGMSGKFFVRTSSGDECISQGRRRYCG